MFDVAISPLLITEEYFTGHQAEHITLSVSGGRRGDLVGAVEGENRRKCRALSKRVDGVNEIIGYQTAQMKAFAPVRIQKALAPTLLLVG